MIKTLLFFLIPVSILAQSEGAVKIPGGLVSYRTFGTAEPILIINGGPGMNCNGFVPLAEKLSAHNMIILYDQRGTGKSQLDKVDASTVTMDLMISDIEALRNNLNIKKWTILGHSFGGMLASYYATIHPDKNDKLIMSSAG
ncbi:MAG TPA: alpha/beta fold hydrolase, partial [Flavobacterium sp.]